MKNWTDDKQLGGITYGFIPSKEDGEVVDKEDLVGEDFIVTGWRKATGDYGDYPIIGVAFRGAQAVLFGTGAMLNQLADNFAADDDFPRAASLVLAKGESGRSYYKLIPASEDFVNNDLPF